MSVVKPTVWCYHAAVWDPTSKNLLTPTHLLRTLCLHSKLALLDLDKTQFPQVLSDTHFRPDVAGENVTDEDRQRYLKAAEAIVMDGMAYEDAISKGTNAKVQQDSCPRLAASSRPPVYCHHWPRALRIHASWI